MSAIIPIRFSRNRGNASNESGVKQDPLYIASFQLGRPFLTLALEATRTL